MIKKIMLGWLISSCVSLNIFAASDMACPASTLLQQTAFADVITDSSEYFPYATGNYQTNNQWLFAMIFSAKEVNNQAESLKLANAYLKKNLMFIQGPEKTPEADGTISWLCIYLSENRTTAITVTPVPPLPSIQHAISKLRSRFAK